MILCALGIVNQTAPDFTICASLYTDISDLNLENDLKMKISTKNKSFCFVLKVPNGCSEVEQDSVPYREVESVQCLQFCSEE